MLVKGRWREADYAGPDGAFVRGESVFRDRVSADGSSGFRAEAGRYHLYVSLACPWAHRTLILRGLKGLESAISVSIVDPFMGPEGWHFSGRDDSTRDTVNGASLLREVYLKADPEYTGRVTTPVLWDRAGGRIVNNESADITRMLNREFDAFAGKRLPDLYPLELRERIDGWNKTIYRSVNNGVYRAGFATTQHKYEAAVREVFAALDMLEQHLARHRYVCGSVMTEADWRLFPTLVRFDSVYHGHFKCNLRRLVDYPSLWGYTRDLYQFPGVAETVDFAQIKEHYYRSHRAINPNGIVPAGPVLEFTREHHRDSLGGDSRFARGLAGT